MLAAILAGARDKTKGTCPPRHISPCGRPAAQISYLKPEQIRREQREQACDINQLSLLRTLIKQMPAAQAWEGRPGPQTGGRRQLQRHVMSPWARGLESGGAGSAAAQLAMLLWVTMSYSLPATSRGLRGRGQDAGSAGLREVALLPDPQSQVTSRPHQQGTKAATGGQTQGRASSQARSDSPPGAGRWVV